MTASGWIFMLVSWSVIIGLFSYCMWRTLRTDQKQRDAGDDEAGETE